MWRSQCAAAAAARKAAHHAPVSASARSAAFRPPTLPTTSHPHASSLLSHRTLATNTTSSSASSSTPVFKYAFGVLALAGAGYAGAAYYALQDPAFRKTWVEQVPGGAAALQHVAEAVDFANRTSVADLQKKANDTVAIAGKTVGDVRGTVTEKYDQTVHALGQVKEGAAASYDAAAKKVHQTQEIAQQKIENVGAFVASVNREAAAKLELAQLKVKEAEASARGFATDVEHTFETAKYKIEDTYDNIYSAITGQPVKPRPRKPVVVADAAPAPVVVVKKPATSESTTEKADGLREKAVAHASADRAHAAASVEDAKARAVASAEHAKDAVVTSAEHAKEKIVASTESAKKRAATSVETAKEKLAASAESVKESVAASADSAKHALDEAKDKLAASADSAKHALEETKGKLAASAETVKKTVVSNAEGAKAVAAHSAEVVKDKVAHSTQSVKDAVTSATAKATSSAESTKDKAVSSAEITKDKLAAASESVKTKAASSMDAAKENVAASAAAVKGAVKNAQKDATSTEVKTPTKAAASPAPTVPSSDAAAVVINDAEPPKAGVVLVSGDGPALVPAKGHDDPAQKPKDAVGVLGDLAARKQAAEDKIKQAFHDIEATFAKASGPKALGQSVTALAGVLGGLASNVTEEGRAKLESARGELVALTQYLNTMEAEEATRLKSTLEKQAAKYTETLREHASVSEAALLKQADELRNLYGRAVEEQREELIAKHNEDLAERLSEQAAEFRESLAKDLAEQASQLEKHWAKEVKARVDEERDGRLARLDHLALKVKRLEAISLDAGDRLDRSVRIHRLRAAVESLSEVLHQPHQSSLAKEVEVLRVAAGDVEDSFPLVAAVAASIPADLARSGVPTIFQLEHRFRSTAAAVRSAQFMPADGGPLSHLASTALSKLAFKKRGLVNGDDVEAVLARAEWYLEEGDVDAAAREMNQLKGWPRRLSADWLKGARAYLEVKQAVEVVETHLTLLSLDAV
ncbi:mitochondrial inner membrane protein-domain-containing protein [Geranomyces variabilis]|nr:mitochondrial inner membrane protein-domain-containing protein [Geranomyces variabilis]KAJ3138912.1 Formation of crista junctions protein 1 [Geranomyces variabilis]